MKLLLLIADTVNAATDSTAVTSDSASKSHNPLLWIIICVAVAGAIYYGYRKKKSGKAGLSPDVVEEIVKNLRVEKVDKLSLADVVNYFKGLSLKKDIDVPFVCITAAKGTKAYLLATYNESSGQVEHCTLLSPKAIDEKLKETMGSEQLVVLQ